MMYFGKLKGISLRPVLLIGLVIMSLIPVRSLVLAQNGLTPLWVVRYLQTSEFGANEPKGLAFSSLANTFLIADGTGNINLITMDEDQVGTQNLPDMGDDPLNMAFDNKSGSLFVFNHGQSELAKIKVDSKGLPDVSAGSTRFAVHAFGIPDPQGIAFDPGSGCVCI
jgi:DNA-binding beta-propeller fold protein YncE